MSPETSGFENQGACIQDTKKAAGNLGSAVTGLLQALTHPTTQCKSNSLKSAWTVSEDSFANITCLPEGRGLLRLSPGTEALAGAISALSFYLASTAWCTRSLHCPLTRVCRAPEPFRSHAKTSRHPSALRSPNAQLKPTGMHSHRGCFLPSWLSGGQGACASGLHRTETIRR